MKLQISSQNHLKRIKTLLCDDLYRDIKHPLYNFMFTYFRFPQKVLYQYSPGLGVTVDDYDIKNRENHDIDNEKLLLDLRHLEILSDRNENGCLFLNPLKANYFPKKVESIRIALRIMENSYKKSPHFNCFGG
jgi:hypothetical protein